MRKVSYYIGFPKTATKKEVVDQFNAELKKVLADKAFRDQVTAKYGLEVYAPK